MPKATLPNKLYPISLEIDIQEYPDESTRPTFWAIMPTMEEEAILGNFYDVYKQADYNNLAELHIAACAVVAPFIKRWTNIKDRDGNDLEYKGNESLRKVLVLPEVGYLVRELMRLPMITYEEKKTSEPSA